MTTYNLFVLRNLSRNSEIDNDFWGDNNGKRIEFETTEPMVGQQVEITGTTYQNYVPVDIRREFDTPMLIVEAK